MLRRSYRKIHHYSGKNLGLGLTSQLGIEMITLSGDSHYCYLIVILPHIIVVEIKAQKMLTNDDEAQIINLSG